MKTQPATRTDPSSAPQEPVTKEQLAELIQAIVFDSGILAKVVERQLAGRVEELATATVRQLFAKELPKLLEQQVSSAVGEVLGSEEVKVMIDSKFRAITLYMKTDLIPKAVKQTLKDQAR